jgi:hypothetical protein
MYGSSSRQAHSSLPLSVDAPFYLFQAVSMGSSSARKLFSISCCSDAFWMLLAWFACKTILNPCMQQNQRKRHNSPVDPPPTTMLSFLIQLLSFYFQVAPLFERCSSSERPSEITLMHLQESPDNAELLSRKAAAFRALSSSFLEPSRAVEHLTKLDQLKDNGIFKGLAQLLDMGVSMAAAKKAQVSYELSPCLKRTFLTGWAKDAQQDVQRSFISFHVDVDLKLLSFGVLVSDVDLIYFFPVHEKSSLRSASSSSSLSTDGWQI